MAHRETRETRGASETPQEATQAENSKDSFNVLIFSLLLAAVAGAGLFWYFGVFPFSPHQQQVQHAIGLAQ